MNKSEKMARNIARSLRIAICEYQYRTGVYPTKIFAELDAYYALQVSAPVAWSPEQRFTVGGISLECINIRGQGIYLSGDPVPIRDLPDGDLQVVFADGTRETIL